MRIITWNINSVRARLHLAEQLIEEAKPDILCLQEIKCTLDQFPAKAFEAAGYPHQAIRGNKAYHGVATLSKYPLSDINTIMHSDIDDGRHIYALADVPGAGKIGVDNYYIPAGGDVPDRENNPKFAHKLDYLSEMVAHFAEEKGTESRILLGDLNIAPLEHDVWNHKNLLKIVSHTPIEVEALGAVQNALPWVDGMRQIIPEPEPLYTWWSYRAKDWRDANKGRRLDHIWTTPTIASKLKDIKVLDHARD